MRFRDDGGQLRLVQATGDSRKSAERALKQELTRRDRFLPAAETCRATVRSDLDLTDKLAPSTRALYERNMRQLVMPAFESHTLSEVNVRKVDQFIKKFASTRVTARPSRRGRSSASPSVWQSGTTLEGEPGPRDCQDAQAAFADHGADS